MSGSTVTITAVAVGSAKVTVTASDGKLSATQTISVTVNPKGTSLAPVGEIGAQTVTIGEDGKSLDLDNYFSDGEAGGAVTYTVTSSNGNKATTTVQGGTLRMAAAQAGETTITITAKNEQGATAQQAFNLTVNRAPAPVGTIPAQTLASDGSKTLDVSGYFSDPDGNPLSYTAISSDQGAATVGVSGSTVTVTAVAVGTATITVYASDVDATGTQTFSVTVVRNRAPAANGTIPDQTLTIGKSATTLDVSGFFTDPDSDTLGLLRLIFGGEQGDGERVGFNGDHHRRGGGIGDRDRHRQRRGRLRQPDIHGDRGDESSAGSRRHNRGADDGLARERQEGRRERQFQRRRWRYLDLHRELLRHGQGDDERFRRHGSKPARRRDRLRHPLP